MSAPNDSVVPPMVDRTRPATAPADETTSLREWLEFHRATLLMKCDGLPAGKLAMAAAAPSRLSLLGLVRHVTGVEGWCHAFDGGPEMDYFDEDEDAFAPDAADAERVFADYYHSVARSRVAVSGHDLDEVIEMRHWVSDEIGKVMKPTSLRWVYQHMIEEYARHNGHADIIREAIDGSVGD